MTLPEPPDGQLPCTLCMSDLHLGLVRCSICGQRLCGECRLLHATERQLAQHLPAGTERQAMSLCRYIEALGPAVGVRAVLSQQDAIVEWHLRRHARLREARALRDALRDGLPLPDPEEPPS